jgi:cobalt-zinc-cadmium efflux system protein
MLLSLSRALRISSGLHCQEGSHSNLNIRATYFHLLSDAVASLADYHRRRMHHAVYVTWIDPALTILIALYIMKETSIS